MRRLALVLVVLVLDAALTVAIASVRSASLYLAGAAVLLGSLALYAAVLAILRIRRSRRLEESDATAKVKP